MGAAMPGKSSYKKYDPAIKMSIAMTGPDDLAFLFWCPLIDEYRTATLEMCA
jgi:hypothetical protein